MSSNESDRLAAVTAAVARHHEQILATVRFVHEHPELAHEEWEVSRYLTRALSAGLHIDEGIAGMPTAFRATVEGTRPGPTVAIVAVYDAVASAGPDGGLLPQHSCGHGPISAAVVGAALALAEFDDLAGTIVVIGAPADELVSPRALREGSGKAVSLSRGAWADIDYALYVHPESHTGVWRSSRWMRLIDLTVPAGTLPSGWLLAAGEYRVEEQRRTESGAVRVVLRVLGGSAEELDSREITARALINPLTWERLGTTEGLVADSVVARIAEESLERLGIRVDPDIPTMPFSTDFGNVSRQIPSAMVGLAHPDGWAIHFEAGERQFHSAAGDELALRAAELIALVADRLGRVDAAATVVS